MYTAFFNQVVFVDKNAIVFIRVCYVKYILVFLYVIKGLGTRVSYSPLYC